MLEDATHKDRAWLLAHPEHRVQGATLETIKRQVERRAKHEPLAYIRGKSEFFGREFFVTGDTLQPRPETETMIELLLKLANENWQMKNLIDVGTGSGCIAVTAKLELPHTTVLATDISQNCLKIAQNNADNLKAEVAFYNGNLLEPLPTTNYQLPVTILANLPYVPNDHTINQAAMHEPTIAIFGGEDGLDYYRELFQQITVHKMSVPLVLSESLPPQHSALETIANRHGYTLTKTADFIQQFERADLP